MAGPWLAEGAAQLAAALREAGPGTPVWTPIASGTTDFHARRFTHETLIHRADAALAVGAGYQADPDVAADAIDEWLYLSSHPIHLEYHPEVRELLGPGRTLHFHATDTPPEAAAEWVRSPGPVPAASRRRRRGSRRRRPAGPLAGPGEVRLGHGEGGTFQDAMTGSACSVPRVPTVPVSSRNSRPSAGGSRR